MQVCCAATRARSWSKNWTLPFFSHNCVRGEPGLTSRMERILEAKNDALGGPSAVNQDSQGKLQDYPVCIVSIVQFRYGWQQKNDKTRRRVQPLVKQTQVQMRVVALPREDDFIQSVNRARTSTIGIHILKLPCRVHLQAQTRRSIAIPIV